MSKSQPALHETLSPIEYVRKVIHAVQLGMPTPPEDNENEDEL